ncbi:hypothetical protein KXV60_004256 [Aspergillus fumigatus]|nr:hypothetical protein KXV71_003949 [Aspergillus fumigatus]KAH2492835.1 hypothetical protein KXV28_000651 [Aspergillus fumigatus]KAH2783573.1 hypothetical protein KXV54_007747 [Aspergillus fumigatus]KAH3429306.1 hypothetical protein KXV60_004256 [Aspergillus fumigatus]KAJ8193609.1 hypothetical protein LV161_003164 [Aspergillus fumigatus]
MSPRYTAQPTEQTTQCTDSAMQTREDGKTEPTDTYEFAHVLFEIKTSPKKLAPILLESLHHRLHHSDVKVYPSFDVLRADSAIKRGNVVFALPAAGQTVDQIILAVRRQVQHLIMDWDTEELSGEGLYLVTGGKTCPWGWSFLDYQAWREQRKRR